MTTERAIYSAMKCSVKNKVCLYEAGSLGALREYIIKDNESTQMYCPDITHIVLQIDDIEFELPKDIVRDFINELEQETNFLTWEDEDYRRMQREESY